MNDWGIVGHEWAVELLQRDVAGERMRHAYLFAGPPGIGKRTLAIKFAQVLNCLSPSPDGEGPVGRGGRRVRACNQCRPCALIVNGMHPDVPLVHSGLPSPVREVSPGRGGGSEGRSLRIDQVRELQRQLALAPYEATYRVPILLRFHEATSAAQNALLKTLEEPPPKVILLLTADSPDLLLPTIVSRCETLNLRPISVEAVRKALTTRWGLDDHRAELLAHLSCGRIGWAVRRQDDETGLARRAERLEALRHLLGSSRRARLAYAEALAKQGQEEIVETLDLWRTWWRDVLLAWFNAAVPLANADRVETIRALAERISPAQAYAAVEAVGRCIAAIERNANLRLALEVLALELPRN